MIKQSADELFEEFSAISDFIESGEQPSKGDRHNAVALWSKMVAKISEGPGPVIKEYRSRRASCAAGLSFEDKDGKPMPVARFEHEVDSLMLQNDPKSVGRFQAALEVQERLDRCIKFLEFYLSDTMLEITVRRLDPRTTEAIFEDHPKGLEDPKKIEDSKADEPPKKPRGRPKAKPTIPEDSEDRIPDVIPSDKGQDPVSPPDTPEDPAPVEDEENPDKDVGFIVEKKSTFQKILDQAGK